MQKIIRSFFIVVLLGFFTVAFARLLTPRVDSYLDLAKDLSNKKDYGSALRVMEKLIALKKEHPFTLSNEFHFKYARVALAADSIKVALESVNKYLLATGREGEFYKEALVLLLKAEKAEETVTSVGRTGNEMPADSGDGFDNEIIKTEGTCDGKPLGSPCWMALINQPECYVWNDHLEEGEIMIWSGRCSDGFAQGRGTLIPVILYGTIYPNKIEGKGYYQNGKRHGHWVELIFDEIVEQGPYVNGKRHGHWVELPCDETVKQGPYVNGKRHGQWVKRYPDGYKSKGKYIDGEREGIWLDYYYTEKECWSYTYHQGNLEKRKQVNKKMCQ